jgi:hypothetical protein
MYLISQEEGWINICIKFITAKCFENYYNPFYVPSYKQEHQLVELYARYDAKVSWHSMCNMLSAVPIDFCSSLYNKKKGRNKSYEKLISRNSEGNHRDSWIETRVTEPQNWRKGVAEVGSQCFVSLDWSSDHRPNLLGSHKTEILREPTVKGNEIKESKGALCHAHWKRCC